jgi:hypothetical protein
MSPIAHLYRFPAIALLLLTASAEPASAQTGDSAREILERCLARHERLKQFEYRCDTKAEYPVGLGKRRWGIARASSVVRRDGPRLEILGRRFYTHNRAPDGEDFQVVILPERILRFAAKPRQPHDAGTVSRQVTDGYFAERSSPFSGGCLDGYLDPMGNRHLCKLMLDSGGALLLADEIRGGTPCFVVRASTSHGDVVVWITKDSSAIKAFSVRKSGADLHFGKGGGSEPFASAKIYLDYLDADSWYASLDNVQFAKIGEDSIASAGTLRMEWKAGNRTTLEQCFHCSRTNFKLSTVRFAADAFRLHLQEGASISDVDNPESGVRLLWHVGGVALADPQLRSEVPAFVPQMPAGRIVWLLALNLCLVSFAFALWKRAGKIKQSRFLGN